MLKDPNVLNAYRFGSYVYGTNNSKSDKDFILIVDTSATKKELETKDIHCYTLEEFKSQIEICDIACLECLWLEKKHILKETVKLPEFILNRWRLRQSISMVSSNSFVKAKKKLIVQADYDLQCALKSFYHAFRILDFGLQIARFGKIMQYDAWSANLKEFKELSKNYSHSQLWDELESAYKPAYNKLSSAFKQLCPKPLEFTEKEKIKDILCPYFQDHKQLNEIINKILEVKNGNK